MKKGMSLVAGCALLMAGAVMAQQPDDEHGKNKNKQQHEEKAHATQANSRAHASVANPQMNAVKQHQMKQSSNANVQRHTALKTEKAANVSNEAATNAMPEVKQHAQHGKKEMKAAGANVRPTGAAVASQAQMNAAGGGKKKPAPQRVQEIKREHANFHAQPKPEQVPAVTFNQGYRIHGSDQWQGRQYEAFRSYHPERHDRDWYHSHFNRVVLIGGGYYYLNSGYWYPAWGYDPANEYYAYDAPIYVGHAAEPPDRVIADVQASLQEMGYYKGEVDGLLGPLTREALAGYQSDNGLTQTEMIDEPTLDSLGMS
jgi:hypothetical protein